jgi:hypothetical protein
VNFTVNGDGEALRCDVKNSSETHKDAQGIASALSEVGCEIMGGKELALLFAGWSRTEAGKEREFAHAVRAATRRQCIHCL